MRSGKSGGSVPRSRSRPNGCSTGFLTRRGIAGGRQSPNLRPIGAMNPSVPAAQISRSAVSRGFKPAGWKVGDTESLEPCSPGFVEGDWPQARERSRRKLIDEKQNLMNAELTRKALEKVGNPNILVNLISRRVRQLNSGGGAISRPLIADAGHLGVADIALLEIVDGKMGWVVPEFVELTRPASKKRRKH